jgi:hypothetical protein
VRLLLKATVARGDGRTSARLPFPERLAPQFGFERFQLAQERFDGVVKSLDDVRRGFLAPQNVGRHAQRERRRVKLLLRMPFQRDVQMHGIRRKVLQVPFQLGDFLAELFSQQLMSMQILGNKIPFKRHRCSFPMR